MADRKNNETTSWNADEVRRQQTQRKQRKKMRRTRFWAIYCAGVVLASCLLAGLGWLMVNDVCALNKAPLTATVEIEKGDSVGQIASKLKKAGIIKYKLLFVITSPLFHAKDTIQPGSYELNTDMDYNCIIDSMQQGSSVAETVKVTIPEGYYPKLGARVMSLQDPKRKMSKSDPDDCFISMLDGPDVVRRKLRRAVTDSESEIRFDAENKPGVSNLLAMLCALTGESMDHAVESFAGKGYGDLKSAVADAIVATLEPIQADYNRYMSDKAYLETVYRQGAERAGRMAERTLSKAMKKIGFIAK